MTTGPLPDSPRPSPSPLIGGWTSIVGMSRAGGHPCYDCGAMTSGVFVSQLCYICRRVVCEGCIHAHNMGGGGSLHCTLTDAPYTPEDESP